MATKTGVKVTGLKALQKRLKVLPARLQRKVLRKAVNKAATPIVKGARKRAPVGSGISPDGTERPPLKKSMGKTRPKLSKKTGGVYIVAGAKAKEAPHAMMVHNGTEPHDIELSEPLVLQNTVLPAGFVIHHPGAKPNPFLEDAIEAESSNVNSILEKEIGKGIEAEAAKLFREVK